MATSVQKRASTSASRTCRLHCLNSHEITWSILAPRREDGFTFLNHGAFGATLKSSLESKRRWAEHIETQPVRFLDRASLATFREALFGQ